MDIKIIIKSLQDIAHGISPLHKNMQWYLFGSILTKSDSASDVDLLIVYKSISGAEIARESLENISHLFPLDLLLINEAEERELNIIERYRAVQIYPYR